MTIEKELINTQALIIGAGPVGLFQVFQLGLLEIKAHVVDVLPEPGGQCVQLYPDKPIYDIPALPFATGRGLTELLLKQMAPFNAPFHLGQEVSSIQTRADGRFDVLTAPGQQFITQTIFIAAGVGAFTPRKLKLDGIEAFEGTQLHYDTAQAAGWAGQQVVVLGGEDQALEAAIELAQTCQVTLVHRRDSFLAAPETAAAIQALIDRGQVKFHVGQITGLEPHFSAIHLTTPNNETHPIALDHLVVYQGLNPKLGPIATWGFAMQRKQLQVSPETFATSTPGIFAVGDINTYPGKKKLILCGFHEATLAAHAAAELIYPERKMPLQYTTTSPRLHQLLGLKTAAEMDQGL